MATQSKLAGLRTFLDTIELPPEKRSRLESLLKRAEDGDEAALAQIDQVAFERGYQPVRCVGPVRPGPTMVCPEDPAHYRTVQRDGDEILHCPVHGVPLVPDASDG